MYDFKPIEKEITYSIKMEDLKNYVIDKLMDALPVKAEPNQFEMLYYYCKRPDKYGIMMHIWFRRELLVDKTITPDVQKFIDELCITDRIFENGDWISFRLSINKLLDKLVVKDGFVVYSVDYFPSIKNPLSLSKLKYIDIRVKNKEFITEILTMEE